jgi:RHS repeat-associated protein
VRQVIDEKQQITQFTYNRDNTLNAIAYANSAVPTPGVSYTYDPTYQRRVSMTDGTGTTLYSYNLITAPPTLGANQLASEDGPLPNDTITYGYDELGRLASTAINGVVSRRTYDAAGRLVMETNALGAFTHAYDGSTGRVLTNTFPNGQTEERSYGSNLQDGMLQRITYRAGATPISEFLYGRDIPANRITTWSQQAGAASPSIFTFGYDDADQLLSATVTNAGVPVNQFAYTYDSAANRLNEQVGSSNYTATYNALNQINTTTAPGATRTNEWDAKDRLVAVTDGNQRTEFSYDGSSRMVHIRKLINGSEVSDRRFVWCANKLCEERDAAGAVTKRFFEQGMKVEMGPNTGNYFYTRDHLGSIRALTDGSGDVRARYAYDPYGRRAKLAGDVDADFGFAGMFSASEAGLALTRFRAYDAELGRWLSRDPLPKAETQEGPNLYAYVANDPVDHIDPLGLRLFTPMNDPRRGRFFDDPPPTPRFPFGACCGELAEHLDTLKNDFEDAERNLAQEERWCEEHSDEALLCHYEIEEHQIRYDHWLKSLVRGSEKLLQCLIKGCARPERCQQPTGPKDFCIRDPFTGNTSCRRFSQ